MKHIIDRFCDGSAEQLVMGMVDSNVLGRKDLERMARKISQSRESQRKSPAKLGARPSEKDDKP